MTEGELRIERAKAERDQREIDTLNSQTRQRFQRDGHCCGCSGHAMEQRGGGWHCYTCGGPSRGCGR